MYMCVEWRQSSSTWSPGQGVDHSLVARGGVNSCQCVCVPDFDGSIKTSCGQQVGIIWLKFTVEDRLYMTLRTETKSRSFRMHVLILSCVSMCRLLLNTKSLRKSHFFDPMSQSPTPPSMKQHTAWPGGREKERFCDRVGGGTASLVELVC